MREERDDLPSTYRKLQIVCCILLTSKDPSSCFAGFRIGHFQVINDKLGNLLPASRFPHLTFRITA